MERKKHKVEKEKKVLQAMRDGEAESVKEMREAH